MAKHKTSVSAPTLVGARWESVSWCACGWRATFATRDRPDATASARRAASTHAKSAERFKAMESAPSSQGAEAKGPRSSPEKRSEIFQLILGLVALGVLAWGVLSLLAPGSPDVGEGGYSPAECAGLRGYMQREDIGPLDRADAIDDYTAHC